MALAERKPRKPLVGSEKPRISPPLPARSDHAKFTEIAAGVGLDLFPWQVLASRYLTATNADNHPLYREVAIIVARQNGKTRLLLPLVISRLLAGKRIIHAAQHLRLPAEFHAELASVLEAHYPDLIPHKRGISWRAGQEKITLTTGGVYAIVAASGGAPRGPSNQLIIIDEAREFTDQRFLAGVKPTMIAQADGQIVYLSNAGSEASEMLNSIRARAGEDRRLAYLEWSASPERSSDDVAGWMEANPAIGHNPSLMENIADEYRAARLGGTLADFETEHLCRWVKTLATRFVDESAWSSLRVDQIGRPQTPYMGIAFDPGGTRASAALAWRLPDAKVAVRLLLDVTGAPIDVDRVGEAIRDLQAKHGPLGIGYDPLTDAQLVRYLVRKSEPIAGQKHANASARFAGAVASGTLLWSDADGVSDDLVWTTRKPHDESGSFQAVRADDERPITAALAAIRAVWLASGPPLTAARVW